MQADLSGFVLSKVYFFHIQGVSIGVLFNFDDPPHANVQHVYCGLIASLLGCCRGCLALLLLFFLAGCILQNGSLNAVEWTTIDGWGVTWSWSSLLTYTVERKEV